MWCGHPLLVANQLQGFGHPEQAVSRAQLGRHARVHAPFAVLGTI
jgi:hypothetical protein